MYLNPSKMMFLALSFKCFIFLGSIISADVVGTDGVETLYALRSPLCWRPTLVGYYSAFEMFVEGIGSVVGVEIFRRCFQEMNVVRIGMVTFMSASVLLAFSIVLG